MQDIKILILSSVLVGLMGLWVEPTTIEERQAVEGVDDRIISGVVQDNKMVLSEIKIATPEVIKNEDYWKSKINELTDSESERYWLYRVAYCESTMNEKAKSPISQASGLYQWLPDSWNWYGCEGDIWNGEDSMRCALRAYRDGYQSWWLCN